MVGLLAPLVWSFNVVRYSPFPVISIRPNPLLAYELKRHGFNCANVPDQIPAQLEEFTTKIGFALPAALSIVGVCCLCASGPYARNFNISPLATVAFYLAIAYSLFVNLYYVLVPVRATGHQINSPEWDTVRVTLLSSSDIVLTRYTIGLLRVWKATAIETGLRTFVAVPLLLIAVFASLYTSNLRTVPITFLAYALPVVVFVLEPSWRTRAVAALGIAISARFKDTTSAILASFGATVAFLMVLAAVLIGTFQIVDRLLYRSNIPFGNRSLIQLVVFFGAALVLYAFYRVISIVCLRRASTLIARSE